MTTNRKSHHAAAIAISIIVLGLCGCEKYPTVDELLPPGTFNLTTVITDAAGNSVDLAGNWAVFQTPDETCFTHYVHYEQTFSIAYSVTNNDVFMLEYDQGRESLPVYDDGKVNRPRSLFVGSVTYPLIYKDGHVYDDFREKYHPGLPGDVLGLQEPFVILDDDTLTYEDSPNIRMRRIYSFAEE